MIIEGESLPVTLGATAPKGNYGSLRTKGWELSADFTHRFSNGLGINVMASISDATTYITKGADYLTPWEDRKLGTTYSTGRRYGDIYGFVTDRLFQKEDFVYGADGQIEKLLSFITEQRILPINNLPHIRCIRYIMKTITN